ncbi:molybdopterin oxidoreductase family protein [Deinococcus yavapaiensis]|uniref:Putative molibdopterin-dependent oxidoreductase YjgC n=1 Tax=Deinococcus yavapaiensis KR-236 TaxID=694435 RepID=A0A318S1R5_9DEIO|nr:nitrate reductase [Deinococcus yavapaiensis]PYE51866.1 putative molibdopterin-dependent oxidoreductase YjgC [Deinococcus yavapaiensis KR-236]
MTQTRDSINDIWGARTPHGADASWPERVDEHITDTPDRWVRGTCVLCSNGCGLDIGVKDGRIVGVRGLATDVTNKGRLGPKGLHGWVANNAEDRLTRPLIRRDGRLQEATWDEAMELVVRRSKEIVEQHTSGAVGFYTSGQLFLEEYYTLAVIGKAGLGTPHMDGNTRLCTATAAAALKESFGSDGQPGAYEDLDVTDTIMHVGHNVASQQTVLWMRILDRLAGPNPPKLIVIDPRRTFTAEKATVHLAPRVGTNVALLNGLIRLVIEAGAVDRDFLDAHTVGYDALKKTVETYTPERVEELTGVPARDVRAAGEILATTRTLVSTVLQGVYQSMQATAAAVQVNNLHLVRGLIGKPGSGILQMNGQPTSQNTRETGADGDLPGFRNWGNPDHIRQLAKLWNVPVNKIPHWSPPTHAMQIWRYCETGSIKFLWIQATNPAVSLPELGRIRRILQKEDLFVVVQDAFMTETARLADVVLPAAIWGEKTGTFTNVSRTVHISCKAVEPPGEARSDLDIFLDYARRMDFRDQDGSPLIRWDDARGAFEAWKECTRGRPCDYTGLTYEKLLAGSGIPWPVNERHPDGTLRLYTDGVFPTGADEAETYGQDFDTGASVTAEEYRANDPKGRALIKPAEHQEPHEVPDDAYPLWFTTGRQVYHFHTRTKTGRARALAEAAPDAFVQLSQEDAQRYGIEQDDWVLVESRRGAIIERARIGNIEPGLVFVPWHYGSWDDPSRPRAANELTLTEWDPVSKQPHYKYAAVRISRYDAKDALPPMGLMSRTIDAARGLIGRHGDEAASAKSEFARPKTTQRVDG